MIAIVSFAFSCVAFIVSMWTAWLTWFHRGTIKMTRPSFVYFGPDQSTQVKINFRALLYSTARRGQWVETMFVKLTHKEAVKCFHLWVYGPTKSLVRGGGLFVGYEGVAESHHFMSEKGGQEYQFAAGAYTLEVYVTLVNAKEPVSLLKLDLNIDEGEEMAMLDGQAGLYFDWDGDSKVYQHHLDNRHAGSKLDKALAASFRRVDE